MGVGESVEREIHAILGSRSLDRTGFTTAVEALVARFGAQIYPALLYVAAHLEFTPEAAEQQYRAAVAHWDALSRRTRRAVDFRVALLDYFIAINRRIKNPKIIEIQIFQKTRHESEIDALTQLHNFRFLRKALERETLRAKRYRCPLSLLVIDVDDFKHYNDRNGHLAGNRALRRVANLLRRSVREVDVVARFGGEEFAVVLPQTGARGAKTIAERLREAVENGRIPHAKHQPGGRFTVSVGVATLTDSLASAEALLQAADAALYRAKAGGKNRVASARGGAGRTAAPRRRKHAGRRAGPAPLPN